MFRIVFDFDYYVTEPEGYEEKAGFFDDLIFTSEEAAIDYLNEFLVKNNYTDFIEFLFTEIQDRKFENNLRQDDENDLDFYILESYDIVSLLKCNLIQ
jgi:restriction endonuclease